MHSLTNIWLSFTAPLPPIAKKWLVYHLSVLYSLGFYLSQRQPHLSLFFKTLGMIFLLAFVMLIADSAILTTPFPLQDQFLHHLDNLLHFDLVRFFQAVHQQPVLANLLESTYLFLFIALKVVPLLLAALNEVTQIYKYVINFLISCLLGFTIYYFWPSTDPASVIHTLPPFLETQRHLVTQFVDIHSYHHSSFDEAGLISFPSFHSIWAILLAYMCWPRKIIFYPVALFSAAVIGGALGSGWHFLVDIIGGGIITTLSIFLTNRLMTFRAQKYHRDSSSIRVPV